MTADKYPCTSCGRNKIPRKNHMKNAMRGAGSYCAKCRSALSGTTGVLPEPLPEADKKDYEFGYLEGANQASRDLPYILVGTENCTPKEWPNILVGTSLSSGRISLHHPERNWIPV